MAEALLGVVFENLLSLLQNEFATVSGIKSKAEKLSTTLDLIKAVLEEAEQKQVTDRSIKVWLQQLKDAVYVLDDILNECSIESSRLRGLSSFKPKNIMFRHDIGNRFKEITRRFDQIAEGKNKFLLQEHVNVRVSQWPAEVAEWRQTSSIIVQPKVYGREDDKEKIVEFLLSQALNSDFLSVYPIVGLGGVGKTTLAQLVYNDHRVSSNFDTKIWVCVSEAFSVKRILCSIVESITREKCDVLDLDVIQRKVQEMLQGKRYFLVLDDVWKRNEEFEFGLSQDKWIKLKSVLSCGSKGVSILVSTRDKDVAEIMGTYQAHHLSGLADDECWLLFKQYAFGHDREEQEELITIGKEIVKKCGGLPLAAQALGGLMRSRREEKEWVEIKESPLWTLPNGNSILPVLRLSYFNLTPTLKQCFVFCAIFPKDTIIKKEVLIHLWMANGFISSRVNLEVEDVGNMIWNELCQKSFFQDVKMDDYSGDISFKMHDLVHDLAQSVMGQECTILESASMTTLSKSTHHIGFDYATRLSSNEGAFKKVESLRTLYQLKTAGPIISCDRFPTNSSLRVLRATGFKLSALGSLIHLRHLVIEKCYSLSRMFPNIGKLACLRTLSVYIVSLETGHNLAELHDLKLGGKLSIRGLENVGSLSEAQEANLMGKKDLQELCLSWSNNGETKTLAISAEKVLEVLQPHSNLKRLQIFYYEGLCFPRWMGILNSLVALQLSHCKSCVLLSPISKLPSLKQLGLWYMDNVQYIDDGSHDCVEVRAFPSLEEVFFEGLPNLERLLKVEKRDMFQHLSKLTIRCCPKLQLPRLPSVKIIIVVGCYDELLRSIYNLYGLTTLRLFGGKEMISFPKGILSNLTCLQTLAIDDFLKLKELPNELFNLALEHLCIRDCGELESLSEQILEGPQSLRTLEIVGCKRLRSLPEGIRHLTSLEHLSIQNCPTLKERCKEEIGEDWDKIAHIPKLFIDQNEETDTFEEN